VRAQTEEEREEGERRGETEEERPKRRASSGEWRVESGE
jgi:hypothetical protein